MTEQSSPEKEQNCLECTRSNQVQSNSKTRFHSNLGKKSNLRNYSKRSQSLTVGSKSFIAEYIHESFVNSIIPPTWEWTLDSTSISHVCQNKEFFINPY